MPGEGSNRIFQFGVSEANEMVGELRKRGIRIKLHSQPFQVLTMLLERPSELVMRQEMQQRLWPDGTFVDFEHSLNTAVNRIRDALHDSASAPRYVETVPGRGYRFIAPVTVVSGTGATATAPNVIEPPISVGLDLQANEPAAETWFGPVLAAPAELPHASPKLVRVLLVLIQAMYLAFYLGALANLQEIYGIFSDSNLLSPAALMGALLVTACALIPVRCFILSALGFKVPSLPKKFRTLFPFLLPLDVLWALSPFLLVHHVSVGLALGLAVVLVYVPFAQRSLMLMLAGSKT